MATGLGDKRDRVEAVYVIGCDLNVKVFASIYSCECMTTRAERICCQLSQKISYVYIDNLF